MGLKQNYTHLHYRRSKKFAEVFVKYFSTIAHDIGNITANLGNPSDMNHNSVRNIQQKWSHNSFSFREITQTEVLKALQQLDPKRLLDMARKQLTPSPIHTGPIVWPAHWEWGEWMPLLKKDDHLLKDDRLPY